MKHLEGICVLVNDNPCLWDQRLIGDQLIFENFALRARQWAAEGRRGRQSRAKPVCYSWETEFAELLQISQGSGGTF